ADRALDDQLDAHRGGEVVDDVHRVDQLGGDGTVHHRVDDVVEFVVCFQVLDVVDATRGEVVEDVDFVAAAQELLGEVAADEAGATGDQIPHRVRPLWLVVRDDSKVQ